MKIISRTLLINTFTQMAHILLRPLKFYTSSELMFSDNFQEIVTHNKIGPITA